MRNTGILNGRTAWFSGIFAALLSAPAWGAIPAHPGMLNYVEGQASINGQIVSSKSVGSADVDQGQILETGKGKAEILLTPGVFLRLGDNSSVRMDANGLTHTSVTLLRGEAMVEADDLMKSNNIQVTEKNATTTLDKNGIYAFNADLGQVHVYDGKATVAENDQRVNLGRDRETSLDNLHVQKFDKNQVDDLYHWSDLRSSYLSEASVSSARTYVVNNAGWFGGGWYWNPYFASYSWLPGDGLFYSPFGYGFFSPFAVYGGYPAVIRTGYGHYGDRTGNFGRTASGFASTRAGVNTGFARSGVNAGFARSSGFRSAPMSVGGGGFHGGGRR